MDKTEHIPLRFDGDTLVVEAYFPVPKSRVLSPHTLVELKRARQEVGRIQQVVVNGYVRWKVGDKDYPYQHDAIQAVYSTAFPNRKVLVIESCEHTGDLRREERKLAAAGISIIDSGILTHEYETGWIEVDDSRSEDELHRILWDLDDPEPNPSPFIFSTVDDR